MRSGRDVGAQGPCQAEGKTKLVLKNGFLEVVDVEPGLRRSKSDDSLSQRSSTRGSLARTDVAPEPRGSAVGRPARASAGQALSASGSVASHESFSDYASVASGSNSSLPPWGGASGSNSSIPPFGEFADEGQYRSEGSQYRSSGYEYSEGSQYESESSAWASVSSHHENHDPRRAEEGCEDVEDAEWLQANQAQHAAGTCRPCLYHKTRAGCASGRACRFCHLPHATKRRARPSKAERMHCKQLVQALDSSDGGPDAAWGLIDESNPSQYMLSILRARDRQQGQPQGQPQAEPGGQAPASTGERRKHHPS